LAGGAWCSFWCSDAQRRTLHDNCVSPARASGATAIAPSSRAQRLSTQSATSHVRYGRWWIGLESAANGADEEMQGEPSKTDVWSDAQVIAARRSWTPEKKIAESCSGPGERALSCSAASGHDEPRIWFATVAAGFSWSRRAGHSPRSRVLTSLLPSRLLGNPSPQGAIECPQSQAPRGLKRYDRSCSGKTRCQSADGCLRSSRSGSNFTSVLDPPSTSWSALVFLVTRSPPAGALLPPVDRFQFP